MREDLTVRDVMTRAYLGVSESDPLRETASLLVDEGASVVAVVRGSEPRGVVDDRQLLAALLSESVPADASIGSVMTKAPPTIPATADLAEAASILSDADTTHLLVVDDEGIAGVLSENDVLTAVTSVLTTESIRTEQAEVNAAAEDEELEADAEEAADVSLQSVCEVCGMLKSDLVNFNGQLVCTDCRSV